MEGDFEIAAFQAFANCFFLFLRRPGDVGRICASIPEHHRAAAVFALRNRALECVVVDRVIFHLHRESLHRRVETRALRHCPTLHDSVELEPQIEVKITRGVFLDYEAKATRASGRERFVTRWLSSAAEVTLLFVLGELSASAAFGTGSRFYSHE